MADQYLVYKLCSLVYGASVSSYENDDAVVFASPEYLSRKILMF